nr:MAG TPA: hypothetical protein [Caudoviricetes sp.]
MIIFYITYYIRFFVDCQPENSLFVDKFKIILDYSWQHHERG